MRKLFPFAGLLLAAITAGCTADKEPDSIPFPQSQATEIPVETALSNLRRVLDAACATRAAQSDTPSFDVEQVQVLTGNSLTRAGEGRNLAYLVNFDKGGYAVLGADTRQAPLIALVKNGSVSPEVFRQAKEAVESGQKVDAPTMMKASMVDYLSRKLEEAPVAGIAPTRSAPVTIKELQDSLLKTQWSPAETVLAGMSRTKIALAQIMVYNAQFHRYYPTMIGMYVLNWSMIGPAAENRHLSESPYSFTTSTMLLRPMNEFVHNDATPVLSSICGMFDYCNAYQDATVSEVDAVKVRQMIYVEKKPTVACFEGMTMEHDGWVMDGWLKMVANGVESTLVHCKFGKDYAGSGDGYYELSAVSGAVGFTQKMLVYRRY